MAIREDAWTALDYVVLRAIGATDAQREALLEIENDWLQDFQEQQRKTGEKKLAVLTPAQREAFHVKVEETVYRLRSANTKTGAQSNVSGGTLSISSGTLSITTGTSTSGRPEDKTSTKKGGLP